VSQRGEKKYLTSISAQLEHSQGAEGGCLRHGKLYASDSDKDTKAGFQPTLLKETKAFSHTSQDE
jgi:hypothetical protein